MISGDLGGADQSSLTPAVREASKVSRDVGSAGAALAISCVAGAIAITSGVYALNRHFDSDAIAQAIADSVRCRSAAVVDSPDLQSAQVDAASISATLGRLNSRGLYVAELVSMQCVHGEATTFGAVLITELADASAVSESVTSQPFDQGSPASAEETPEPRTIALAVDSADIATLSTALNGSTDMPWLARMSEVPKRSAYRTPDTLEAVSEVVDAALAGDSALPVGSNAAVLEFSEPYRVAIDAVQSERSNRWKRSVAHGVAFVAGLGALVAFRTSWDEGGYIVKQMFRGQPRKPGTPSRNK